MSTIISLQTILWSALAAAAGIGLPVLVFLVWKFKFCRGAKLFPAVVGAVTFVVFAQVLEGVPKAIFFGGGTGVSQYVLTHAWAYTLIGCLYYLYAAFIWAPAFRKNIPTGSVPDFLRSKYDSKTALTYSYINVFNGIIYVPLQLFTMCTVIQMAIPGISLWGSVVVGLGLAALYTAVGGIHAAKVVGRATWYKISYIYVSVKDLAELTSEGETSNGTLSDGTWGGTVLRTGSTGSAVEQLQFWLNTLAQYDSAIHSVTVDGVFGSGTAAAVRAFQRKYGLTVDGVVGRTTWTEVYDQFRSIQSDNGTPNAYPGTALREGSSGQNVRLVQFWLKIARTVYTSLANVTVDGKFGAGTAAAVQRFQRYFGLTADGVVGRTTWQKLYEVYNDIANRLLSPSLRPGEYPGVLRTGSSGTAVRELQFYLYLMSAYESSIPPVSIDGKFGADTERAVRAYQRFAGLTVDGVVGRTTWNSLYGRASQLRSSGPVVTLKRLPYPGTPLTVGSSGSAVLYYTLLLQRIAYYFSSVEAPPLSDQYTDETAAATRSAQQLLGLEQTGVADADTWTAVEALSLQLAAHAPNPDRDTPPSTAYPGRAIAEGSAGQEVGQVERWLNRRAQLSCGEDYVADNNRFGAADAAAVRAVQQQAGLLVTGIVNRDTWAALQAQSCNCDKEE